MWANPPQSTRQVSNARDVRKAAQLRPTPRRMEKYLHGMGQCEVRPHHYGTSPSGHQVSVNSWRRRLP